MALVCPWWLGFSLLLPLRRFVNDPEKILRPYVRPGMRALDVGSGMGYFSLPLARRVGDQGKVVCVDLQENMLRGLARRARAAGLAARIEPRKASAGSLGIEDLAGTMDFALVFAMLHEVPDQERLLREALAALKPGGILLFSEPVIHVPARKFTASLAHARQAGFVEREKIRIPFMHSVLLAKP